MTATTLTAGDLMTRDVLTIHQDTLMRDAARLLHEAQVSGAPVVDEHGTCVGVLSATDFVRLAGQPEPFPSPDRELPVTCGFQRQLQQGGGAETTLCRLTPGTCPMQRQQHIPGYGEAIVCNEPHCVPTDWQVVNLEKPPTGQVRRHMTPHPITVEEDTPIDIAAQRMIEAGIHRLIVVDEGSRPVGIVSSTDILAVVAYRNRLDASVRAAGMGQVS
jgi:CBS domain-containing protein